MLIKLAALNAARNTLIGVLSLSPTAFSYDFTQYDRLAPFGTIAFEKSQ
jgi:hypothetical protein